MEFEAMLMSVTKYVSKKTGKTGAYIELSIDGRSKRVFTPFMPEKLDLEESKTKKDLFLPSDGRPFQVVCKYELGGYGQDLGIDIKGIEAA